jgi:hypothetical protein
MATGTTSGDLLVTLHDFKGDKIQFAPKIFVAHRDPSLRFGISEKELTRLFPYPAPLVPRL